MTVNGGGRPPDKELFAEMGRFVEELTRAGVLLATGGLDRGTRVTASGGNVTFTDGPFTESKEVIVSFALIEVRSAWDRYPPEQDAVRDVAESKMPSFEGAGIEIDALGFVFLRAGMSGARSSME